MSNPVTIMRLILGLFMLASGIDHFVFPFIPVPPATNPLAQQLILALIHSGLFDVVKAVQLVVGFLLIADKLVPLALCLLMPLSVCAAYYGLVLDRQAFTVVSALVGLGLNGLLMLAYLDYYRGVLATSWLARGESAAEGENYEQLYARPIGKVSMKQFVGGVVPLVAVAAFYYFLVPGGTPKFAVYALIFCAVVLVARLVQGMRNGGRS